MENGQDKALKEAKASAAKYQAETEAMRERLASVESEKAELRQDHATEASGFASARRELEVRSRTYAAQLHDRTENCFKRKSHCYWEGEIVKVLRSLMKGAKNSPAQRHTCTIITCFCELCRRTPHFALNQDPHFLPAFFLHYKIPSIARA